MFVLQVITSRDGILLNNLQASSMRPHFAYISTKLFPTKSSGFAIYFWMICSWAHLHTSRATMLAHAFSIPTKVTRFGRAPSCCICQNSSSVFCHCPHFTCPYIMVVQVTTSWDDIFLNALQAWHILQVWHSKWPYHVMTSCWTLSKRPPCSHSLHTWKQS